jgi:hypothetical protein
MPSTIDETVLSEPSGRPETLVHFAGSLAFASLYLYTWSVGDTDLGRWLLVMAVGAAVAGTAESLPTARRQTAGALRLVAILLLLCLVTASVVAPELVIR